MAGTLLVYNPVAPCYNKPQGTRNALDTLSGKTIGFIDNSKPNFQYLVDDLAELLKANYGVAQVIKRRKPSASQPAAEAVMKELVETCDAVITGSGD